MNPNTAKLIKTTSSILITGALGLELWNVYLLSNNAILPGNIKPFFWVGSVALVAHGVEGFIAAFLARDRNINPVAYGIYTFFVGFVGLKELEEISDRV